MTRSNNILDQSDENIDHGSADLVYRDMSHITRTNPLSSHVLKKLHIMGVDRDAYRRMRSAWRSTLAGSLFPQPVPGRSSHLSALHNPPLSST